MKYATVKRGNVAAENISTSSLDEKTLRRFHSEKEQS